MTHFRCFGIAFALLLLTQAINSAKFNLTNYILINFLQDVRRLHTYDQLVFVHNRNATMTATFQTSFGSTDSSELQEVREKSEKFANLLPKTDMDYETQFVQDLLIELVVPVVLFNEFSTFVLKQYFSTALMIVVYLDDSLASHATLLRVLVASLKHRTLSQILFLINGEAAGVRCDALYLQKLFDFCWLNNMINVVALCSDYKFSGQFYSYTHFPDFALEYKSLDAELLYNGPIYPYRLGNMHGFKISYIIGSSEPRVIVYNYNGHKVVGGFSGHFLRNFATKHNCTLFEPLPSTSNELFAPSRELIAAVRNNTVDISIGLTFPTLPFDGFTYPYEQLNWCIWIPIEADIPHYDFIWIVFQGYTFLLTLGAIFIISFVLSLALQCNGNKPDIWHFIIHDACLHGVLGQPFRELPSASYIIRFIYLQICMLGILFTTLYNSYFATYWTSAPKVSPMHTFDDILNSKSKVYVFAPEYSELIERAEDLVKYIPMFQIERDYHNYLKMRDSFDTKYIYVIPTTKWQVFKEQQKMFTSPIFRMRHDLCLFRNIPMCFPVQSNSIFLELLEFMMLETAQSGLTEYWMKNGFLELIRAGRLHFVDLSQRNEFRPMKIQDMKIVWMGYVIAIAIGVLVFLIEICYYKRKSIIMFSKRKVLRKRRNFGTNREDIE